MDELQVTYNFETLPVRTYIEGDIIWFVLKDVCAILGIKYQNDVWSRLDDDERGWGKILTPRGGKQRMQLINEPGLYNVILRSNSEKAKPFRRWVTHDVLPSIRKRGFYSAYGTPQETIAAIVNDVEDDDRRKVLIEGIKLSNVDQAQFVAELMDVPKVNLPKKIRDPSDANSRAKWMMRNWKNRYTKSDIPDGIVGEVALDSLIVSLRRSNPSHFQRFCGTYYFDDFGYADLVYLMAKRGYIGDERAGCWVAELNYNMKFGKEKYHPAPDQSTQDGEAVSMTES